MGSKEYRNKRTGVVITTPCACSGADWELITKEPKKEPEKAPEKKVRRK